MGTRTRRIARWPGNSAAGAVLNPAYPGWQEDLGQCREEFGMPVLRLVPEMR